MPLLLFYKLLLVALVSKCAPLLGELVLFGSVVGNWWDLFCGVKKKLENNVAHFHMVQVSLHLLIQSCSFPLSTLPLSQESLISQDEVPDFWKTVEKYLQAK